MRTIQLQLPASIITGAGVINDLTNDRNIVASQNLLFLTAAPLESMLQPVVDTLKANHTLQVIVYDFPGEPTFDLIRELLDQLTVQPDCVIGTGGGSVLDCAKLLAALCSRTQTPEEVVGMQLVKPRTTRLICIPTTAGTGSEMSPNAIFLDTASQAKSAVISKELVPDAAYLDPELTFGLPARLTAETGMDALSHCIEAYTNINAHPMIDLYALEGISLIAANLLRAVKDGNDTNARSALLLGSMYGGICLGPVNTAAVHALSYGLGGKYHISHGLANAILLPSVMEYNAPSSPDRHAEVARALGATGSTNETLIRNGIQLLRQLAIECGIPQRLGEIGITQDAIPELVEIAMKVTRLLNNNPRKVSAEDASAIYQQLI